MSMNLDYEDLWNELYEWCLSHNKDAANMMEEMDPRLEKGTDFCEACGGPGVFAPATPSCEIEPIQPDEMFVERCDSCEKFPDDLSAALSISQEARIVRCDEGAPHVVIKK